MVTPWVIDEMKDVDLCDKRLNQRLCEVLSALGGRPTASIPAACCGYAETMATYRLFDNKKVHFQNVLAPHIETTLLRMKEQPVVILAQDTTEIDLTRPNQSVVGSGPLDKGTRRGVFLHPLIGFTPDGTPLGTIHAKAWARDNSPPPLKSIREARRKHTPIEDKESRRWVDALQRANGVAEQLPATHFISVSDSESDIYELLMEAQAAPANVDWIVRGCQDRALSAGEKEAENNKQDNCTANRLSEQVSGGAVIFSHSIQIRGRTSKISCEARGRRQPRQSRTAEVAVRAAQATLRPPWRYDRTLPEVTLNVVLVSETDPPPDDVPVEWMLLTSLPIDTIEHVREVIQYYCVRWMIEIFFRTLKSGCRVEDRRLEHVDRFLPCLAVYMIITWRTLFVCRVCREYPDISCEGVFEPAEWKSVFNIIHRRSPPLTPPTLSEMVHMVAQLGGYVPRKAAPPGPQTVWLGLQRTYDIALCWQTFGPEAAGDV